MFAQSLSTAEIKNIALKIGFDVVGVTKPEFLTQGEQAIQSWVEEGLHGSMKYLENFSERRKRFFEGFEDARSVVVLGVNYFTNEIASPPEAAARNDVRGMKLPVIVRHKEGGSSPQSFGESVRTSPTRILADVLWRTRRPASGPTGRKARREGSTKQSLVGRVARYAWGRDYHEVIRGKHEVFIRRLKEVVGPSLKAKSCVDIQPVPERFVAVKAGLGFIGKHTGLLSQKFGPWLFLSEIVTNLELEEDIPSQGDCGTCTHCQKVCPTGALDEDYRIDARLCIAYLTIEHKGIIPRELRPKMKDWIFGCDECLAICPFTSKSKQSSWKEFYAEAGHGPWLLIDKLFKVGSKSEYEKEFQGTALLRASRKQMLRNACIVLGNSGSDEAIPYLIQGLRDSSTLVRLHAAWALGRFSSEKARRALENHLHSEIDPDVRSEILSALGDG